MASSDKEVRAKAAIARLHYFFGQLLTQRDLEFEQRFHLLLQRLTQREGFGTGTVAGLKVSDVLDGQTSELGVWVLPGFAVDPDGRELVLGQPTCVTIADAPLAPANAAFSPIPNNKGDLVAAVQARFGSPFSSADLDALVDRLAASGLLTSSERDDYANLGVITRIRSVLEQI